MFSFEVRILNKIKLRSHSEIIWELDARQKNWITIRNRSWDRDNHPLHFQNEFWFMICEKISGIWNWVNISSAISALDIIWFRVIGFATEISINLSNNVNFFPNKFSYIMKCFRCTLMSTTLEIGLIYACVKAWIGK